MKINKGAKIGIMIEIIVLVISRNSEIIYGLEFYHYEWASYYNNDIYYGLD